MIKIRDLDFSYEKFKALNNINVDIDEICTGFLGPNGSGKSTILKILSGILDVSYGNVLIDDKSIQDISKKNLSKIVAIVTQDLEPTFDFNVREIIEMGRYPYLNTFGFLSKKDKFVIDKTIEMLNLSSISNNKVDEISSGQKQKVRIARALVQEPHYLLLDEPTSNLDLSNKILILDVIKNIISNGTKVIVTSHDLRFIGEVTNKCFMISEGKIIHAGQTKEILNKNNVLDLFDLKTLPEWVM
tara:strand:+ start:971 stop:1702 length:732 start_codon:yes stop_codon:yes gene_type:complete